MKKVKIVSFIVCSCLLNHTVQAQQAVVGAGGSATGTGGSASFSVGQVVYTSASDDKNTVLEGVQHAYEVVKTIGIDGEEIKTFAIKVFPNPTVDQLIIETTELNQETLQYKLIDGQGKVLKSSLLSLPQEIIDVNSLVKGSYVLVISTKENTSNSFKIIKN